jgi:NAD(P)-dependent dehydrogenase (short-subunit alcohol dehydrogenase family)
MAQRSVLVTGGTGGLGTAVTAAFAEAGWRVVVPVRAGSTTAPPAPGVTTVTADLTDPAQAHRAVTVAAGEPAKPLRAVVNLVGGYAGGGRIHETSVEDFEGMLTLNLRPTFLVTREALVYLVGAGGGAVVCVSSRAALAPFAGAAGYITAKAAVLTFANAVAVEYRGAGVRCNTVVPGVIDTPANRAARPDANRAAWAAPADIARVIRFLAGDESAPTTGATIPV